MIFEGLKLMFVGMFVVYIFLSVLFVMIKVSAYFFSGVSQPVTPASGSARNSAPKGVNGGIAAVIAAALSASGIGKR
ncbi:OadG family transporter subunit [Candidatus Mycalebacterium sp.]